MRFSDIRRHSKPYSIVRKRATTINNAFASSIAPRDVYDEAKVRAAIAALGQNPEVDLVCVYCDAEAKTWDHVHATVKDKEFSGYGHRLGNLLPCCKSCNPKKGNKDWRVFLAGRPLADSDRAERERKICSYLKAFGVEGIIPEDLPEYQEHRRLRLQVLEIFARADVLAGIVRSKSGAG